MKKEFHFHLLLFVALTLVPALAKAQFRLTAEVRPRTEFRNGFKTPTSTGFDPAFFTEQRSRLYVDFADEKYKLRFSLQDVRLWGQVPQIFKNDVGTSFLSEAWGQYFVSKTFSIKAGRQILSYDNQRFFGGLEWAQQGRRHDALLFIKEDKTKGVKLHVGLAFNADADRPEPAYLQGPGASFYSVGGSYKSLQYAWYNKAFKDEKGSISLLALNATLQNPDSTVSNKNGLMDYFFVGPANGSVGVFDLYLKTKFKVAKGALLLHGHQFLTGSRQLDGEGTELSKAMGFELDAVYVRKLAPAVTLHVGASVLLGTETLTTIRPGNQKFNQWAWTMITFKPALFDSDDTKKKKKK